MGVAVPPLDVGSCVTLGVPVAGDGVGVPPPEVGEPVPDPGGVFVTIGPGVFVPDGDADGEPPGLDVGDGESSGPVVDGGAGGGGV